MDGKVFAMKDFKAGETAPPFHPNCRSTTCPYFDEDFSIGERAARGEDGKTYYVPSDMTYKEWVKINSSNEHERPKIKDKETSITSVGVVDKNYTNGPKYHLCFNEMKLSKKARESLYNCAINILDYRNGTEYESIYAIDSKSGKIIAKNNDSIWKHKTYFNEIQEKIIKENPNKVIVIHNHPSSSDVSIDDIKNLFRRTNVTDSIVVGHNGNIYQISKTYSNNNVDKIYEKVYNECVNIGHTKIEAELIATDYIIKKGIVKHKQWIRKN